MTTIKVGGINQQSAPSPLQRTTWHDDWESQLTDLSAWSGNSAGTEFSCTTASSANNTENVVDAALTAWVDQNPGNRDFSVT